MDLRAKLGLHLKKKSEDEVKREKLETTESEPGLTDLTEGRDSESIDGELIYEPINQEFHLSNFLPGKVLTSDLGEYFLAEYRYPLTHFHGRFHLGALEREDLSALCGVLKDQTLVCPTGIENLLFLDTETTGLAGGTGTYAFLVGIGYFTEEEFILRQYLMEDYHQELAMLDALYTHMQNFTHLVTFNGKSFDWPLLEGRLIYNRMRGELTPIHVDLLHPARRYYKIRLENCRLGSLEDQILGFTRTHDISGAEVPALYFDYLDEKDGRILLPVMQHNHWDILSLVTLLAHLVQAYLRPEQVLVEPEDLFSAGKIFEDLGQHTEAIECYTQSLASSSTRQQEQETLKRLSFLYKRLGRTDDACAIWRRWIEEETNSQLFPYLELAKYFEHQCKDYTKALEMTQKARELVLRQYHLYSRVRFKELLGELQHREERLIKRLEKIAESLF